MAEIWKGRPNTPPAPPPPPPPPLQQQAYAPPPPKSKVLKNVIAGYGPSQQQGYYQQGPMVMGPPQQQGYYGQQIQQQGCIDIWYFLFEF
ncbi:unnamed protein product [Sphagnum troendelagicum]